MSEQEKPTTFLLFRRPLFKDWTFILFFIFLAINAVDSLSRVMDSGGPSFAPESLVSGGLDALYTLLGCYAIALFFIALRKMIEVIQSKAKAKA